MNIENFKENFKIISPFAPIVFTGLDGRKWAIAMGSPWIEIPSDFTIDDVMSKWEKPKKPEPVKPVFVKKVISRKKEFIVTLTNKWSCTCSGFKSKKTCTHLEEAKNEYHK